MKNILLITICFLLSVSFYAQEILTKQQAIEIAFENNFDIKIAKNNVEIAENSKSIYNSGYLPTVTANSGANYTKSNSETIFQDGDPTSVNGVESRSYNASVGLNYTLFDGFNRKNTFKRLKQAYNLSELQGRDVIENALTTLFFAYYEVARLTENEATQSEALAISKERLQRASYGFDYGQSTKLDVLNAEVDVNNDSITYIDIKRQLNNAKRDLNVVLGRDVNTPVNVNTDVDYTIDLNLPDLLANARENNALLLQTEKSIELSKYDIKINQAGWMPNVALTSSYAWNRNNNEPNQANPFSPIGNEQTSINGGISFSWNIFDGGRTKTNVANAKIALDTQQILKQQQEKFLERDVNNAWETYQNALFSLEVQKKNVTTNKHNFERTNEQYKLGQVTSLDFRQSQINLINAELNLSEAKYTAKNAELELLQLGGRLIENANF